MYIHVVNLGVNKGQIYNMVLDLYSDDPILTATIKWIAG